MRSACMRQRLREAAERTINLAERHIDDQRNRIARQRELVADLERDGHGASIVESARELLRDMLDVLHRMTTEQRAAQKRLHQ
jgi:uncharacterized protein YigA (DUF484 family)